MAMTARREAPAEGGAAAFTDLLGQPQTLMAATGAVAGHVASNVGPFEIEMLKRDQDFLAALARFADDHSTSQGEARG